MKLIKNNRAILRIAGVKTNEFKSLNNLESIYFKLEKEQLRIERKINDLSIILDNLLYKIIENTNDIIQKKNIINLKRKIYKKKNIIKSNYSCAIFNAKLNKYLDEYIENKLEHARIKEKKESSFYISDLEINSLINIYKSNQKNLDNAIALSSLTFLSQFSKFIKEEDINDVSNKKRNDLTISLYKYITRATYKTSPFSFFCYQGIASFCEQSQAINKIDLKDNKETTTVSLINNNSPFKYYKINRNVWFNNHTIEVLKKNNVNYRNLVINNKNSIIKISYNSFIEDFITRNKNEVFTLDQLCKKNEEVFGYNFEETKEYIEFFCEIGIIEVASYYNDLEEVSPPKIKKISINHNRNERIKYFNESKMKIYEDVYLNNIAKIDNSFYPNNTQINVLNKLSLLWDDSVLLKKQFIEYIGKTRKITSYELINLLTDFYKVKDKVTNTQLADIISIRKEIINMVKENANSCMETDLSVKKVNELYRRLNYYSKMPISYTYFLQPNLDNSYVLNKVFSGYGRMFSKFQSDDNVVNIKNMHRNSLGHLEEEVKYLDLYGIYGFNANVHQTVTDYILDIENIWGGYELKDLSLAVDFERKELSFYLGNKRVFPITLGAISSRMLPLFHRFLCDVNHIDSMDLDLNRRFIYSDWYELSSDKIKFIPRVKAKDIILARNKWLIDLSRYNSFKDESKFYSELIRDIEANLIPSEFYVKPIDVKEISNVEQMNDFFKPQFINMKLITSYKLMYRIAKKCNFLLLEESKPNSLEKEKYPGDFKGATTEIGVESYFVQLGNN